VALYFKCRDKKQGVAKQGREGGERRGVLALSYDDFIDWVWDVNTY
jgi:hypothetical protein